MSSPLLGPRVPLSPLLTFWEPLLVAWSVPWIVFWICLDSETLQFYFIYIVPNHISSHLKTHYSTTPTITWPLMNKHLVPNLQQSQSQGGAASDGIKDMLCKSGRDGLLLMIKCKAVYKKRKKKKKTFSIQRKLPAEYCSWLKGGFRVKWQILPFFLQTEWDLLN